MGCCHLKEYELLQENDRLLQHSLLLNSQCIFFESKTLTLKQIKELEEERLKIFQRLKGKAPTVQLVYFTYRFTPSKRQRDFPQAARSSTR